MKKREQWKENLVTALDVPRDLAYGDTIVSVIGKSQAIIENYRSILRYTKEEIVIQSIRGRVVIQGKRLEIPCYTPCEMEVRGCISGIFMEN